MNLKDFIEEAEEKKVAIGHFNISDIVGFWAVVNASKKLNVPVIIGVSEGERAFLGVKQARALVDTIQEEGAPVFLNADHTYSLEKVEEVIDAGFNAVIIDKADQPLEENIKITKEVISLRKNKKSKILVEAELGFIGKSSNLLDAIPEGAGFTDEMMTKPDEAERFVKETGVDLFAPAVGNIHGMLKSGHNPKLNIERIKRIKAAAGVPLVLHGGSGINDYEFKQAIEAGISIIHLNTEIRLAYKKALQNFLKDKPDEIAPYKFLKPGMDAMQIVIEQRLRLFNSLV